MARREKPVTIPPGGSPSSGPGGPGIGHNSNGVQWALGYLTDRSVDPNTHNLLAGVGERCMICDRLIVRGQPVRRTISGGYAHDNC